jgi:hypothetical protein
MAVSGGVRRGTHPKIVRLINKFPDPPNKDVGEGLNTAFEAMKKLRLKEPEIKEADHSVIVHIGHAPLACSVRSQFVHELPNEKYVLAEQNHKG